MSDSEPRDVNTETAGSGKTGRKKRRPAKIRRSLNHKTFFLNLLLTMGIGITVLIAVFVLYLAGVLHEYFITTWNQANAEAAVIEQTDYRRIADEVVGIYDSMSEEERGDGTSAEYTAKYDKVKDDSFKELQEAMHSLQNRNGPLNAFIVAFHRNSNRMIYICDADVNEKTTCRPGTWDVYPEEEIDALINGMEPSTLEKKQGIKEGVQAVFTNHERYGPRCTAGATLYQTDEYTVMVCVDEKLEPMIETAKFFLSRYIVLLLAVTFIASLIGMIVMRRALVDPINRMSKAAGAYGEHRELKDGTKYFDKLNIHTGDELERLASTLEGMEEDMAEYVDDLTSVTAEKERIKTELNLAASIQRSMLQAVFPPFPDRHEFEVFASMEPAKEIGGDFYDMIMLDDDHLAIEIADVSGKGIPAALFMMASKIMLADGLRDSLSPASILEEVNNKICENNKEEMFVTVWLGILELSTGKLTASNAGHEYPVIVRADGTAELIKDKHGFVIGAMEDMVHTEYEIQLEKGDSIYVYTDGVTEATSVDGELFGLQRVLDAAGSAGAGTDAMQIMKTVRESVREFCADAEQFDDLTMLCLRYLGPQQEQ